MLSSRGRRRESLRGRKSSGEQRSRFGLNTRGNQGHGFPGGSKPLERRGKVVWFCRKAQERREKLERVFRSPGRSKALKSEAQERWGLKEVPEDSGARHLIEGVAKPQGGTTRDQGKGSAPPARKRR
jgi:hypothetical protein